MNTARREADDETNFWRHPYRGSASASPDCISFTPSKFDPIDCPTHYAKDRRFEVIDVLEDWAGRSSDPVMAGLLWSALKYQGRMFDKAQPLEDARKARWYLDRLISKLEARENSPAPYEDILKFNTAELDELWHDDLMSEWNLDDDLDPVDTLPSDVPFDR